MSSPSGSCSSSLVSLEKEEKPLKRAHTCREGGWCFVNFRNLFILLVVAVIVLIVFSVLIFINGHYSSSGLSALYALILQPWPAQRLKDENKSVSYMELLEMGYYVVGSFFVALFLMLIYAIHVLRKTLYSRHPWDRSNWNTYRLVCGVLVFSHSFS
jgi:hypothetical protein